MTDTNAGDTAEIFVLQLNFARGLKLWFKCKSSSTRCFHKGGSDLEVDSLVCYLFQQGQ